MIQIPRSQMHQLRTIFRKLVKKPSSTKPPFVSFQTDRNGLRVRLHNIEVLAEFQQPGTFSPETISVPFESLSNLDGRGNGMVTLENTGPGTVQARWEEGGVPQVQDMDVKDAQDLAKFPSAPSTLTPVASGLLKALADASGSAARESVRYALQKIQLRGRSGEIVGTDGRQLLLQAGFRFPFKDDLLIPSSPIFGAKELTSQDGVSIGADKQYVTIQSGAWMLYFPIDKESRYPRIEQVIPAQTNGATRCHLKAADASFLAKALPKLPGGEEHDAPVTVDLNGEAIVRAKAADQDRITEVVLTQSEVTGKPIRFNVYRDHLARALELGFTDLIVVAADKPILCQDAQRKYVCMPLGTENAIGPSDQALRIVSSEVQEPIKEKPTNGKKSAPRPQQEEAVRNGNGNGDGSHNGNRKDESDGEAVTPQQRKASNNTVHDLLEEAAALRNVLRDAYTRTHRLMVGLQRNRKQSQIMRSTLASLRQLQTLEDV